jgi:acylglycerol lipase
VAPEVRGEIRTPDGFTLATACWVPDTPRAVIFISHGHAEHLGRYAHLIEALVSAGYAVYGQDHRGHGRSSGERALVMRFDSYIEDFRLLALTTRDAHPDLPQVVLGHSMGGLIASRYALAHGDDLAALVISGAAFVVDDGVSAPARLAAKLISRFAPRAPVPRDDSDTLSYDPAVKIAFNSDPLNYHGKTRMRTAVEMSSAGADALARASELRLPLLAMHGGDDTLTSPRGTEMFYERASSTDKTLVLWPHMKHEIFNEIEPAKVIAFVLEWLDQRFGGSTIPKQDQGVPAT